MPHRERRRRSTPALHRRRRVALPGAAPARLQVNVARARGDDRPARCRRDSVRGSLARLEELAGAAGSSGSEGARRRSVAGVTGWHRAARQLETAWMALEEAVDREGARWQGEIEKVRRWTRPRWPLWVITALVLGAARGSAWCWVVSSRCRGGSQRSPSSGGPGFRSREHRRDRHRPGGYRAGAPPVRAPWRCGRRSDSSRRQRRPM